MDVTEAVVIVLTVTITVGLPMFTVAMRFAVKPLLDAYIQLRRSELEKASEHELLALRERVALLENVVLKDRELRAGSELGDLRPLPRRAP